MKKLICAVLAFVIIMGCMPVLAQQETALMPGDKGYEVHAVQAVLKNKKLYTDKLNGVYDRQTQSAVVAFQMENALTTSGMVDIDMLTVMGLHSDAQVKGKRVVKKAEPLRLTASTKGLVLAELKVGTAVQLISSAKGWSKVRLYGVGVEGYVRTTRIIDTSMGLATELIAPQRSLARGEQSADIATLQKRLIELGYYEYSPSGSYGSVTYMAIRSFQKHNSLEVTGVASIDTLQVLFSEDAQPKDLILNEQIEHSHDVYIQGDVIQEQLADYAQTFLGLPYILGAKGPNAYDCSGFTSKVFKEFGIELPRPAYGQGYTKSVGQKITKISDLRVGDLVFFNTNLSDGDKCDHVGIFIGEGRFVHASFAEGKIIISDIYKYYWKDIFSWGRRVSFS